MKPLLLNHRRSINGDEAISQFTTADVAILHLIDEKLDDLFPQRYPEDQDLEDDLEDQVTGGDSKGGNSPADNELPVGGGKIVAKENEVEQQDAEEANKEEEEEVELASKSKFAKRKRAKSGKAPKSKKSSRA